MIKQMHNKRLFSVSLYVYGSIYGSNTILDEEKMLL